MPEPFSVSRSRLSSASDREIHDEINRHTGSDSETSSILRSIARFGVDATITRYEVNPTAARSTRLGAGKVSWSVRALRG